MFSHKAQPTWIFVEALSYPAVLTLISKTLHRPKDECEPLANFVHHTSFGNAFSARSVLHTLQRQHHVSSGPVFGAASDPFTQIKFDWEKNHWTYDMMAIKGSFVDQHVSDPTDLNFLVEHLRSLPEEARKYLTWAVFFGETWAAISDLLDPSNPFTASKSQKSP